MEFLYFDCNGEQVHRNELASLQLWNPVMEHILAEIVSERAGENVPLLEGEKA